MWISMAILALALSVAQAEIVTNGGFDGENVLTNANNIDQTATDGLWYNQNAGDYGFYVDEAAADPFAQVWDNDSNVRALVQIIGDGNTTTGVQTFSFDWVSLDDVNVGPTVEAKVGVYGFQSGESFKIKMGNGFTDPILPDDDGDADVSNGDALLALTSLNVVGGGGTWNTFSQSMDLGDTGYDRILVYFDAKGFVTGDIDDGFGTEVFGVDNVSLVVPEPATMSLLGLGGLVALRRRRR
jgi:hypothetical protein